VGKVAYIRTKINVRGDSLRRVATLPVRLFPPGGHRTICVYVFIRFFLIAYKNKGKIKI